MAKPAQFSRCVMISGGRCKDGHPWMVNTVQVIEGVEMVTLSKSDSGFSRFVTGEVKGIGRMIFLDHMKNLRTAATFESCNGGLFEVANNPKAKKA